LSHKRILWVTQFSVTIATLLCAWLIFKSPLHIVAKLSVILQLSIASELVLIASCLRSIVELIEERLK